MHRTITAALLAVVAACAFSLSYGALVSLARTSHMGGLAVVYPIQVDGCAILAGYVALISRSNRERFTRRLAVVVMVAMTGLSLSANVIHAAVGAVGLPLGAHIAIGSAPALSLLACAELAIRLLTKPAPARTAKPKKTAPATSAQQPASEPASPRASSATSRAGAVEKAAVVNCARQQFAQTGEWPSGPVLGEKLGQSRKSGARLRAQLLAEAA